MPQPQGGTRVQDPGYHGDHNNADAKERFGSLRSASVLKDGKRALPETKRIPPLHVREHGQREHGSCEYEPDREEARDKRNDGYL